MTTKRMGTEWGAWVVVGEGERGGGVKASRVDKEVYERSSDSCVGKKDV